MVGITFDTHTGYVFFYVSKNHYTWPEKGRYKLNYADVLSDLDDTDRFIAPSEFTSWAD